MQAAQPTARPLTTKPCDGPSHRRHLWDARSDCWQLRVCALVLSVCTFGIFLFMELMPEPDVTLLALGTLMVAWIGPLTLLAGTQSPETKGHFTWWQPFEGGFSFVCMQAFGWSMIALFLALCLVILANFTTIARFEGQFLLLGIVAFIAQALLNLSIDQFVVPDERTPTSLVQRSFLPGWSKALVAILVSLSGTIFFAVYDSGLFASGGVLLPMGVAQFALSAVLLHVCVGVLEMPVFGWSFFTCMVVATACLMCLQSHSYGLALCSGLLGLVSQVLLLSSLYCFKASEHPRAAWSYMQIPEEGFLSGIFAVFACLLTTLVCHSSLFPCLYVLVDGNTRLLGIVCLLLLAGASPVAHCGGYRSVRGYKLWQPFVGDSKFVFLQSMGWLWYGIFLGVSLLLLLNDDAFLMHVLPLACVTGSIAALAISLSMPFFEIEESSSPMALSTASMLWTGEYELSLLLSFATIGLHLSIELLHLHGRTAFVCLALGLIAACVAAVTTHGMGTRLHEGYVFWQPFCGGDAYVLRQALGWTFFSIFMLFDCVSLGAMWNEMHVKPGVLFALSLYMLVPQVVLASSLTLFAPTTPAPTPSMQPLRVSMLASAALDLGSFALFCCAEGFKDAAWSFVSEVLFVIATMVAVIGLACTHCICGPQLDPSYRVFQPLIGGLRFVVYQGVGWTLAVMAWVAACTVIYWHASFLKVHGVVAAIGMMFFVAQTVLLGSLRCFEPPVLTPPRTPPTRRVLLDVRIESSCLGPVLGLVSCAAFAVVDLVLLRCGATLPAFPLTVCAATALFASIPLTYRFANRGRMLYQVLGYTLGSFTLLLAILFSINVWHDDAHLWLGVSTGAMGFAAHFVLLFSLSPPERLPPRLLPLAGTGAALLMCAVDNRLSLDALLSVVLSPMHVLYLACCVLVLGVTVCLLTWMRKSMLSSRMHAIVRRRSDRHVTALWPHDVVLTLCDFLTFQDLAHYASTSRAHRDEVFTADVWHTLFLRRAGVTTSRHDDDDEAWRRLTHVASTQLFSDTLCVRVERVLLQWFCDWDVPHARVLPPTLRLPPWTSSVWKRILAVVDGGGALYHCELCAQFEVLTPHQARFEVDYACGEHQTSSWVPALCHCTHPVTHARKVAHRRCLERSPRTTICDVHATAVLGWRPPTTMLELSRTTRVDATCVLSCLKVLLVLAAGLQYAGFGWKAPALYLWLLHTTLLSSLLHSPRFDAVIRRIWDDLFAFPLYLRLYYTLFASSFLVLLWCSPLWSSASYVLHLLFVLNVCLYALLSALTLFAFWKTHAGVRTVLSPRPQIASLPLRARCTLCRLHLCVTPTQVVATTE
ncbi:hypothetical protein SPRG_00361 [Saprolegnia parasitica CBS 223.65]|uniref:Transmembrane protein n=1 Tax=Saprolegnia parasitica (strain CBS 223.65) TaxID=695850 RepID=A0A067CXS8_SAPPC|nr:hypothetical protein SPRG_00361 [Saprolegnia parasitica CBS 223.65]KDO35514.1 hypothetical protein SPRG_00361 [Saprolegnia parasitica CBS 223.65]|eukprot:XP_012193850.1 hypothetical protein SPRG_00361 [Saprolegnia parasitica CBS 223.65]